MGITIQAIVTYIGSLQLVDTHVDRIHVVEIVETESTGDRAVELPDKSYGTDFISATVSGPSFVLWLT